MCKNRYLLDVTLICTGLFVPKKLKKTGVSRNRSCFSKKSNGNTSINFPLHILKINCCTSVAVKEFGLHFSLTHKQPDPAACYRHGNMRRVWNAVTHIRQDICFLSDLSSSDQLQTRVTPRAQLHYSIFIHVRILQTFQRCEFHRILQAEKLDLIEPKDDKSKFVA